MSGVHEKTRMQHRSFNKSRLAPTESFDGLSSKWQIWNLFPRRRNLQIRWWWAWWPRSRWTPAYSSPRCAWRWRPAALRRWGSQTGWTATWRWRGSWSGWLSTSVGGDNQWEWQRRWFNSLILCSDRLEFVFFLNFVPLPFLCDMHALGARNEAL